MAITYKNYLTKNITTNTVVYNPTTSGIQSTLVGLIVCNNTANTAIATITITSGGTTANITTGTSIPVGTSLNIIDSNRLIVGQNNSISVTSSSSVDVTISAIEVV